MARENPLQALRYLHTIHAVPECERLRHIYLDVFGGFAFHESYYGPEDRDAARLYVADHMIEVMAPRDPAAALAGDGGYHHEAALYGARHLLVAG